MTLWEFDETCHHDPYTWRMVAFFLMERAKSYVIRGKI